MARGSFPGAIHGRPIPEYSAAKAPDSTVNAVSAISRIGRGG
jgi:hypothetical protein